MTHVVEILVSAYMLGLIGYSILSWIQVKQAERLRLFLGRFYEPVLSKIRGKIGPRRIGGSSVDLAPGVLLVALIVLKQLIIISLPKGS